ncbi:PREDICTED: protein SDE2 homolog [Elephantulus edwardii]|uniref:protein SDE2 homolog n=1 Tax=Elephantulus edwardii TaxID=28737 RepID=UPI0003F0CA95|nr:PREDICTED: protein SDE2 homolog [Elephantulus edwardii]
MAEAGPLVWVRGPGPGGKAVSCGSTRCSVRTLLLRYCHDQDVPEEYFFVKCNGALVNISDTVQHGAVYSLEPRLCGGKGGFGSMLRALGAQIEKTTNREACRDLSGRRLRDVNHEKAMAEWVKQQAEREAEKEQKRLERLQRKLAEPKHCFSSPDYQQQCHEMAERLEDSVLKGMQAASSKVVSAEIKESRKRPNKSKASRGARAEKRKCFWLGMDELEHVEGSSSETSDDDSEESPSTSGFGCQPPKTGSNAVKKTAECLRDCHRPGVPRIDCDQSGELQKTPAIDTAQDTSEDSCSGLGKASPEEQAERKMPVEAKEPQKDKDKLSDECRGKEAAKAGLKGGEETNEMTAGEGAALGAPGQDREHPPSTKQEGTLPGSMHVQGTVDLLAFSSVSELEALGLDLLKSELMALGLKCGGTLQERAARLYSVRGLTLEQIDPALFAKPSKGKKK